MQASKVKMLDEARDQPQQLTRAGHGKIHAEMLQQVNRDGNRRRRTGQVNQVDAFKALLTAVTVLPSSTQQQDVVRVYRLALDADERHGEPFWLCAIAVGDVYTESCHR